MPPNPLGLSEAAVLLLAANLTSLPQLGPLQDLVSAYPQVLHISALLQLLLNVLPETISPEDYLPLVYKSFHDEPPPPQFDPSRIPTMYTDQVSSLSHSALRRKLALYGLSDVPESPIQPHQYEAAVTQWFFDRARKVEEATGMIDLARRLVLPDPKSFGQSPPFPPTAVTLWAKGIVQVLETFIFENDDEDELRLLSFENLDPESAVRLLLSRSTPETIQLNVRHLVTPFAAHVTAQFPGKDPWLALWEWLLDHSGAGELDYVRTLGNDWVADEGLTRQFLKTNLMACYLCQHSSSAIRSNLHRIHSNVSRLSQPLSIPSTGQQIVFSHPETDLLSLELRNSSPLTTLTVEAIAFLDNMITSADIVAQAGIEPELCLRDIVLIREGPDQQLQLLNQLLRSDKMWTKRNTEQWTKIRLSILWLQSQSQVLAKVPLPTIDAVIFTAILDATAFTVAREIFVIPRLLPPEILEKTVLEVFYRFYDSATNGNRTRGDMKFAFQTLQVLDDPANTPSTSHAVKLVGAMHALSNYSISLTPGISLTPAQIRTTNDPALLISQVVETNSPVYRDGDRMLRILHDLIEGTRLFASRTPHEAEQETTRMEARVNATIVKAALAENDFNTAYDVCIKKLMPVTGVDADAKIAEIAWVAFFQTATFSGRPQTRRPARMTQTTLDNEKMDLLSLALMVCPKEEMDGIVSRWTDLESKLYSPAAQQAEVVSTAPLTRGSGEYHRGFFETAAQVGRSVARTASPMLGSETFEGRRSGGMEGLGEFGAGNAGNWRSSSSRFGVRDTVKSGLTQGIGWLLGAPPTHEDEHK